MTCPVVADCRIRLFCGVGAFALVLSAPVSAQEAGDDAPEDPAVEGAEAMADAGNIVVSGSRIQRPNLKATVPITSLTNAELVQTGNVNIGDRIALLPQFRPTFTS